MRILERLLSGKHWNVRNLALDLECSERTIYRDLQVLELMGIPFFFHRDSQSLRVQPGFRFPTLPLTPAELLGQATATRLSSAEGLRINEGSAPTTRKLAATLSETDKQLLTKATEIIQIGDLRLANHRRQSHLHLTIQEALLQGRQLKATYRSPYQRRTKTMKLLPLRLCLLYPGWYLIAQAEARSEPHLYRIARFRRLELLATPAPVPQQFDLAAYLGLAFGALRGHEAMPVELEFSSASTPFILETHWHSSQMVQRLANGRCRMELLVCRLEELIPWLATWGGEVQVISPAELRQRLQVHHQQALQILGDSSAH